MFAFGGAVGSSVLPAPFYLVRSPQASSFDWEVRIDGKRVPMQNLSLDQNDLLVDLEEFMAALTGNRSAVQLKEGRYVVLIDGIARISLPRSPGVATLIYGDPTKGQVRKIRYGDEVSSVKIGPKNKVAPVTAFEELCSLLGLTVSSSGRYIDVFTPGLWWQELGGAGDRVSRLIDNFRLGPDFGVSPPSDFSMYWVRPPEDAWVQVFEMRRSGPETLLSAEEDGSPMANVGADIRTPKFAQNSLGRFTHRSTERTDFVSLVAVVSKVKPEDGDMLEAIRSGQIKGNQVCVVGVRQERRAVPFRFGITRLSAETTVGALADRWQMDIDLFRYFNGLDSESKLAKGTSVFYLDPSRLDDNAEALIGEGLKNTEIQGYYLVRAGESVESIAKNLKVDVDLLYDLNQDVLSPGMPISAGITIVIPEKAQVPAELASQVQTPQKGSFRAASATTAHVRPDPTSESIPIKANELLDYSAITPDGKWLRVFTSHGERYVLSSAGTINPKKATLIEANPLRPEDTAVPAGLSRKAAQLVSTGLQFIGTRYSWGGNDLRRGIDCSHYVSQIFRRVGVGVSAPVHNMETSGRVVWTYGGVFHRGSQLVSGGPTGRKNVAVGDRFIYQSNPGTLATGRRTNGHHVSFYAGDFTYKGKPYYNKILEAAGNSVRFSNADTANARRLRFILRDDALYR